MMEGPRKNVSVDSAVSAVAWVSVILLFWRALEWIAKNAVVREQVDNAALVLLLGVIFLLMDRPGGTPFVFRFGPRALQFYAGACVCAGLAAFTHHPVFMLCGLGFLAGAVLLFVFGDRVFRLALGFGLAFAGFTVLVVLFPLADWPLRLLAGKTAAWFLGFFGDTAPLGLAGDPPHLILVNAGRPFEVAPECNGFGIIGACTLLAVLLVFSRRLRVLDKALVIVLAPVIGLLSNALRIFLIVVLAPLAPGHYQVVHEAVGIALFWGTLVFLWWLVAGLPERRLKSARAN